jgi:hypothetical protein
VVTPITTFPVIADISAINYFEGGLIFVPEAGCLRMHGFFCAFLENDNLHITHLLSREPES